MTLPLRGEALNCQVFDNHCTSVVRLREPYSPALDKADFVIVRSKHDVESVREAKPISVIAISDDPDLKIAVTHFEQHILLPSHFAFLGDGDVLGIDRVTRRFRVLYRQRSSHNSFLVTDRCNHYCLMCSQPPKRVDDRWILDEIKRALPLIDRDTRTLGFTGGETLTDWPEFIALLKDCREHLPNTSIHVLSNGRAFARAEVVDAWADVRHPNLMVGIPIYSCVSHVHDYVVQAANAFDETVLGILRLKNKGQRVEIRVVLHSITAPRIVETCRWIARNLPFVDHVALMGLEHTGFAIANDDLLWIDPIDYRSLLTEAVEILAAARVRVSVFNLPRCLLDRSVWTFAVQSISDWKNDYHPKCEPCVEKERCAGFFTTGRPRFSRGIEPIVSRTFGEYY